jgi:hypothetical protein
MEFFETSKSINVDDLVQVENELNIKLSEDFKTHYLRYNGGYPKKSKFLWEDGDTTRINAFLSIKHEGIVSMELTYKYLVLEENYLPEKIMPFALDDGGNFFCVSFRDHDYDHIYYSNDDHYNVNDNEEHLVLLTISFGVFIDNLI